MRRDHDGESDEIVTRDLKDSKRSTSPLLKTDDAIEIDTGKLTKEEVFEMVNTELEKNYMSFIYSSAQFFSKSYFNLFHNFEVIGLENIPEKHLFYLLVIMQVLSIHQH